jgi:hypothetical protein
MKSDARTLLAALGLCLVLSACAYATSPVTGFLYSDVDNSQAVTSNRAGNRAGEACAHSLFGLVAYGDASTEAARRNGGVTEITSVDSTANNYFGVYAKHCIIVRGR